MNNGETTFFLTRKGLGTILLVKGIPDGPRHFRVRAGCCHQRIRKKTIYHTYHETFEAAKICARVDLEVKVKKLKQELATASFALDSLVVLSEGDL